MEDAWYDDFTAKKQPAKKEPPGSDAEPAKPPATAAGGDEEPEYLNKYLREHYSTDKRKAVHVRRVRVRRSRVRGDVRPGSPRQRDRVPPLGRSPPRGEDKAGKRHRTAVLSATLGRCSPHPDDKDITDALSAFLGPDRDFYASAGLPQYIWCIIRHIGIDAIVAGASKPGSDQADVQDEFMRVIYGSGECLLFHPKAGGCLVTGGVKVG
eukprot:jgi/Mesvir1/2685/Mv22864-RA.1